MGDAFVIGLVAGLSVALPLGAVAILLIREGLEYGRRAAVAGAVGIATVDTIFATVAVLVGPALATVLASQRRLITLLAAGVLLLVALVGIVRTVRSVRQAPEEPSEAPARGAKAAFGRFFVVTLANPLTIGYFTLVAVGVAGSLDSSGEAVAFVLGVGLGSLGWQLVLALAGSALGGTLSVRATVVTSLVGYALVAVLALVLLVGA